MTYLQARELLSKVCRAFLFRTFHGASWILGILITLCLVASARGASEVVVAMRYFQEKGVSHSHLYLYLENGKLIRQLTNDDTVQDTNPFFAPDGNTIVFTRAPTAGKSEIWSIEPRGGGLKQLSLAPDWYKQAASSPDAVDSDSLGKPAPKSDEYQGADGLEHYKLPDGSAEIIVQKSKDLKYPSEVFFLEDLKTGKRVELVPPPEDLAPLMKDGEAALMALDAAGHSYFVIEPPMRFAFVSAQLSSGGIVWALDLNSHEFTQIAGDGYAIPIPLPGEGAFLSLTGERYVPFGTGKKTANSSYLERWDAQLKSIRYARDAAGLCYGASMYRPGKKPLVIWVPRGS